MSSEWLNLIGSNSLSCEILFYAGLYPHYTRLTKGIMGCGVFTHKYGSSFQSGGESAEVPLI